MNAISSSALALAVAYAVSAPASAVTLEVARRQLPPEVTVTGTSFDVDAKAGRVRVAVDYFDESFEGSWFTESFTVPGLVYDRTTREVRYEGDGASVTCAAAKKTLWTTNYPLMDGCRITVGKGSDPGGDGSDATIATVRLVVDPSQRAADLRR